MKYEILKAQKEFGVRFPHLAPIMVRVKFVESSADTFYVSFEESFDKGYIVIHYPKEDPVKRDYVISILHEILHVLFGHTFMPEGYDVEAWREACEYMLQRYMLEKGVGQKFYEDNVEKWEKMYPQLKSIDVLDIVKIYKIFVSGDKRLGVDEDFQIVHSGSGKSSIDNTSTGKSTDKFKFSVDGGNKDKDTGNGGSKDDVSGNDADKEGGENNKMNGKDNDGKSNVGDEKGGYIKDIMDFVTKLIGSYSNSDGILIDASKIKVGNEYLNLDWGSLLVNKLLGDSRYSFHTPSEESLYDFRAVYPSQFSPFVSVVVIVDVSGSMSEDEIVEGLKCIKATDNIEVVKIITHDTKVKAVIDGDDYGKIKMTGGGTSYDEVYEYVVKNFGYVDYVVHITDGICDSDVNKELEDKLFFVFTGEPDEKYKKYQHIKV